jgi:single-strand DNA-binding protein
MTNLAYGKKGGAYLALTISTLRPAKDRPDIDFHRVTALGDLAEWAQQQVHEGDTVFVAGFLRSSKWEDAQGVKHYRYEVIADMISVCPVQLGKSGGQAGVTGGAAEAAEDIPF